MMAPHQTVILNNPPIILLSIQTRPTDQALSHEIAKFRINRRKSIPYKIYVPMWTIGAGAMDRSADFVQLLSQFVQQIEGEWTPDLEHGPTRLFESDLRRLRKTYWARSRRLNCTCGPKG